MSDQEIKPYSKPSGCGVVFSITFLIFFGLLFNFLVFSFDNYLKPPATSGAWTWIAYIINAVLDVIVLLVFVFGNFYLIRGILNYKEDKNSLTNKTRPDSTRKDVKTVDEIFYAVIAFAIVGFKILFKIFSQIISALIADISEHPGSSLNWIPLIFFSFLAIGLVIIFRLIFKRFNKVKKYIAAGGKMDVFTGMVIDKQKQYTFSDHTRGSQLYMYSFKLDTGKEFTNVLQLFYDRITIGQTVEVHAIPYVGEILHLYVKE
jgi:hypothetical protein